jgi:hypothetical protein
VRRAARQRSVGATEEHRWRAGQAWRPSAGTASERRRARRSGLPPLQRGAAASPLPCRLPRSQSRGVLARSWPAPLLTAEVGAERTGPPVLRHHTGGGQGHLHPSLLLHHLPLSPIHQSAWRPDDGEIRPRRSSLMSWLYAPLLLRRLCLRVNWNMENHPGKQYNHKTYGSVSAN